MEKIKTNLSIFETALKLVRFSVFGEKVEFSAKERTEESVRSVLALAKRHSIFTLVADGAFKCGLIDSSTKFGNAVRKMQVKSIIKIQKIEFQVSRLKETLAKAQIKHIPLKGAVIRAFYPERFMRSSCDVDILVKPIEFNKAAELLQTELGYKYCKRSFYDMTFESNDGIHVELHHSLVDEQCDNGIADILHKVWDYSEPCDNNFTYSMSDEMLLFYHIAHMAKHMLIGGCGIRTFIDLKLLLENLELDRSRLNEMLQSASLKTLAENSYKMCEAWFGNGEHTALTQRFQTYILGGGTYGSSKYKIAVKRSEGVSHFKHILSLAILPKKNLELLYPNLVKHPWLTPFYQIKRWFRVFNRSKRSKIAQSIETSNKVSDETVENVSALMTDLGLK